MAAASDAVTPAPPDDGAFFDELPIVLSVSRLAQPLADAPGSVTVIDAETIRRSGARDLADLLRTVPGFLVAQSTGGAPLAVYHGMTDENPRGLQILVDGRSQYSPLFFGGVPWNLIDVSLDDIERVEVIRGSNSAAYGSNAFLGVVNVLTRQATSAPGGSIRLQQGGDGVADRYARLGWQIGRAAVGVSAERQNDNGVNEVNDSRRNDRLNFRAELPLGLSDELQLLAGGVDLALATGQPGDQRLPPRVIEASKQFVSAGWRQNATDGSGASLRYTHTQEYFRDVFVASDPRLDARLAVLAPSVALPYTVLIDQRIQTTRDELEFQQTLLPGENVRWVWGAGLRRDRVWGEQFYGVNDAVQQKVQRVFGNLEWRPGRWVLNLGATWEDDSLSDASLAPRLSANYHLSPRQTLRASASRAHRIPTLTEARARTVYGAFDTTLLSPALPNAPAGIVPVEITRHASGHLAPERIDVQELAYLGDFREQRLFVDLRAFDEQVRNRIVPASLPLAPPNCELVGLVVPGGCGAALDFINGQDLVIRGLEYQLRWRPRTATELTLNQTFVSITAHANATFVARDPKAAAAADRHMARSAPKVATMLRWSEQLPFGLEASIAHYRYARFQWTVDSAVGPFHRTDLRLAGPLKIGSARGELAFVMQGAGRRHAEYRDSAAGSNAAAPQFLEPRGWLSLTLGI